MRIADPHRSYRPVATLREGLRLFAAGITALTVSGCSILYPMPSLMAEVDEPQVTQSVEPRVISPLSPELGTEDWRRAKAALAVALDPQGSGAKVSWDNPDTTIKGHFAAAGQPFVKGDEICRAFHATIHGQASTEILQGSACRPSGGEWDIKDVKPARKT